MSFCLYDYNIYYRSCSDREGMYGGHAVSSPLAFSSKTPQKTEATPLKTPSRVRMYL